MHEVAKIQKIRRIMQLKLHGFNLDSEITSVCKPVCDWTDQWRLSLIEEHLLGHHMYADDTQLRAHLTINDIPSVATRLQNCIEAISRSGAIREGPS